MDHTVGGAVNAVRAPNQWGGTGARAGEGKLVCTKERKPQLWIRVVYTPVGGWQTAAAGVLAPAPDPVSAASLRSVHLTSQPL